MSTQAPAVQTAEERINERIDKSVTREIVVGSTGALAFQNVDQMMEVAKMMAISGVAIPKHLRAQPGACLAVAIQAAEWQMSPYAVAGKSYVVNDRLSFEAQLVNAVILRRAPIVGRFKCSYRGEDKTRRCKVWCNVRDPETKELEVVEYESPEIGKIPVQNSPLWKGDPDQQLFYYSSRAMCRRHFPDVILGIYTPEEMAGAIDITSTSTVIQPAQIGAGKKKESVIEQAMRVEAETHQQTTNAPTGVTGAPAPTGVNTTPEQPNPAQEAAAKPKSVTEAAVAERKRKKAHESAPHKPEPRKEGDEPSQHSASSADNGTPSDSRAPKESNAAPTSNPEGAAEDDMQRKLVLGNIHAKAKTELNCGKTVIVMNLQELGWLNEGESFDSIDLATAQGILERWEMVVRKVKGEEGGAK